MHINILSHWCFVSLRDICMIFYLPIFPISPILQYVESKNLQIFHCSFCFLKAKYWPFYSIYVVDMDIPFRTISIQFLYFISNKVKHGSQRSNGSLLNSFVSKINCNEISRLFKKSLSGVYFILFSAVNHGIEWVLVNQ